MSSHRRTALLSLVVALACLALVAPTASARFYPIPPQGPGTCETAWADAYRSTAPADCEQQAQASRGTGAPAKPTEAGTFPGLASAARQAGGAPHASSPTVNDPGFDWGAAAIGAIGAAALIALLGVAAPALRSRRRVQTAR